MLRCLLVLFMAELLNGCVTYSPATAPIKDGERVIVKRTAHFFGLTTNDQMLACKYSEASFDLLCKPLKIRE